MFFGRLKRRLKMAKSKRNIGLEILEGLREINRGEYGRVITIPNVAGIREKTGLSQARFAQLLGVSVRTLQDWSKAVEHRLAPREHCLSSRTESTCIARRCVMGRECGEFEIAS